jgi:transketolase
VRKEFTEALLERTSNERFVFITGDLGFMALEPIQTKMGARFINGGIAEQNMISVAAGLAKSGFDVWAYSIAPFCYARPFEQIRNDIAMHNLPVRIVGNGGGYGYGVMGPTHHAIEDYGVLLTLPNMNVCVPIFDSDVRFAIDFISALTCPVYLRLGLGRAPDGFTVPDFASWRQLTQGGGPVVVSVGPIASTYIEMCEAIDLNHRPNLWAVAMLPVNTYMPPAAFLEQLADKEALIVVEEHVRYGSFGSELALILADFGLTPKVFKHLYAQSHCYDRYGSQKYLREKSLLDVVALKSQLDGIASVCS